ncbi:hypothetical protein GOBAR_DD26701 [Gossypium barbadense]|nr:hypothetical protein GOBAR_DD26701 [Gossypium barbadense]
MNPRYQPPSCAVLAPSTSTKTPIATEIVRDPAASYDKYLFGTVFIRSPQSFFTIGVKASLEEACVDLTQRTWEGSGSSNGADDSKNPKGFWKPELGPPNFGFRARIGPSEMGCYSCPSLLVVVKRE